MDTTKIKVKIGNNEFEAEGPVEVVKEQFQSFKDILTVSSRQCTKDPSFADGESAESKANTSTYPRIDVAKILHVAGRVVSLTALPTSTEDAALLIMLGHKDLRDNVSVTGQEIGDGLAQSGRPVGRVDRIMEKALTDAFVLKTGIKRATRYRLTNQGLSKALGIAAELIASLP